MTDHRRCQILVSGFSLGYSGMHDTQINTSPGSKSMVIQGSLGSIMAMNQTGSWGVDLQRMRSAVVMTHPRTALFYE